MTFLVHFLAVGTFKVNKQQKSFRHEKQINYDGKMSLAANKIEEAQEHIKLAEKA